MKIHKSFLLVLVIFFLIILIVLFVYFQFSGPIEKIKKPDNVPNGAVWDGGADGGNWIYCTAVKDSVNIFKCTEYNDYNGEILYEGKFKLEGETTSLLELRNLLGIYSGDYIYLKDGRKMITLIPIDSINTKFD